MIVMIAVIAITANFLAVSAQSNTVTVNSTGQAGDLVPGDGSCNTGAPNSENAPECTLNAAIQEANGGAINRIEFDIPLSDPGHTAGVWTISPTAELTNITQKLEIDARTQPGYAAAGGPVVELDGTNAGNVIGIIFRVTSASSALRGLSIINYESQGILVIGQSIEIAENYVGLRADGVTRGPNQNGIVLGGGAQNARVHDNVLSGNTGSGIVLDGANTRGNLIDGNLIGTTADGTAAPGSGPAGISLIDSSDNVIGGTAPNIISGNAGDGIVLRGGNRNIIENNIIGASITGAKLKNGWSGIAVLEGATNTFIGAVGSGNTIVGNDRRGIHINDVGQTTIEGNFVGTDSAGTAGLGNRWNGILVENQTSAVRIAENTIVGNALPGVGVRIDTTAAVTISQNSIFDNLRIPIDLNSEGPTANDPGDGDGGANSLLNWPEITDVTYVGNGNYEVTYTVSAPVGTYTLELFESDRVHPLGRGELQTFLTDTLLTTGPSEFTVLTSGTAGAYVSGTLTHINTRETSEVSNAVIFPVDNLPPTLTNPGTRIGTEGNPVDFPIVGSDPDGDPLTWTITNGLPPGLSIHPMSGWITGTPTVPGTYFVTVRATDPLGEYVSTTFRFVIDPAPTPTTVPVSSTVPPTPTTLPPTPTTVPPTTTTPVTTSATTAAPATTVPATSTTVPPTSTSTTSTSTIPATTTIAVTTPAATAAPTISSQAPATTAAPAAEPAPPAALPFTAIVAVNDSIGVSTDQAVLDVIANDSFGSAGRLVSVTQPAVGSAEIVDGELVVSLPPSFAGDLSFDYTITDESGVESTASVQVFSVNILAPTGASIDAQPEPFTSANDVIGRLGSLVLGLVEIRLNSLQLSALAFGPPLFGLMLVRFTRREDLVSVTNTARTSNVGLDTDDGVFKLRHNAVAWTTGKTRKQPSGRQQTRIELPNGEQSWIDTNLIVDTGF